MSQIVLYKSLRHPRATPIIHIDEENMRTVGGNVVLDCFA
jgi:hypothetical protein